MNWLDDGPPRWEEDPRHPRHYHFARSLPRYGPTETRSDRIGDTAIVVICVVVLAAMLLGWVP